MSRAPGVGSYRAVFRLPFALRTFVPALAGAAILLLADVLARTLLPAAELPIGVVTATLGAPVFIWLLVRLKERQE